MPCLLSFYQNVDVEASAYLALTTVMHAVFTSMLGITLPFAAYGGKIESEASKR